MSVQLLDKTRKINKLLHNNNTSNPHNIEIIEIDMGTNFLSYNLMRVFFWQ